VKFRPRKTSQIILTKKKGPPFPIRIQKAFPLKEKNHSIQRKGASEGTTTSPPESRLSHFQEREEKHPEASRDRKESSSRDEPAVQVRISPLHEKGRPVIARSRKVNPPPLPRGVRGVEPVGKFHAQGGPRSHYPTAGESQGETAGRKKDRQRETRSRAQEVLRSRNPRRKKDGRAAQKGGGLSRCQSAAGKGEPAAKGMPRKGPRMLWKKKVRNKEWKTLGPSLEQKLRSWWLRVEAGSRVKGLGRGFIQRGGGPHPLSRH